jgi:hypothetical protein
MFFLTVFKKKQTKAGRVFSIGLFLFFQKTANHIKWRQQQKKQTNNTLTIPA